jgi:hypothetical protein
MMSSIIIEMTSDSNSKPKTRNKHLKSVKIFQKSY